MTRQAMRTIDTPVRAALTAIAAAAAWLAGAGTSAADINRTPIAIPLIGTQGTASPYPSSITIDPVEGAAQTGQVSITLHSVTHPCPRDLSVLLVHGADKWLLMNNAGRCRPMQGTTIEFVNETAPLIAPNPPDEPFGEFIRVRPTFDGQQPAPPPPFPAGGTITSGMPTATTTLAGKWDLYVLDQAGDNRGVIAGGWSLNYDTAIRRQRVGLVTIPAGIFSVGPAQVYPITFDMSNVRADVVVSKVTVSVDFSHDKPDDMLIVLQSPSGECVIVMGNAGGTTPASVAMTFDDLATQRPPNLGPLASGTYQPTLWPEATPTTLPAPGPQPPYMPAFIHLRGEPVRGQWKLWIADDAQNGTGLLASASIVIRTQDVPAPALTSPLPNATSTQPFVRVEGMMPGIGADGAANWRVVTNGTFYAAGALSFDPETDTFFGYVPVRGGDNRITVRGWNTPFFSGPVEQRVNVSEFTYALAEGATGGFFDLDVTLGNPGGVNAPVTIDFLPEGSAPVPYANTVTANTPLQLAVDTIVADAAVSTIVHSTAAQPLAVERTMSWDTRGYGAHGGGATAPATRWLFAEGSQGFFDTFVLLANDNTTAVDVTVKFLLEGGGVVNTPVNVPAKSRRTIFAGSIQEVVNRSFGLDITSTKPIIAERAMYFSMGTARTFDGGHESPGVNAASTRWFLAEGATGSFFDCFVLLSNPNASPATVALTYLLEDGSTINQGITLAANSRQTINVEAVDPRLANAAVSTIVSANIGIVVERAMYWPNVAEGWREAHNSFGVTEAGLRWAVADGRLGGARGYDTYILLANPNPVQAEVEVRFLKAGATVTRTYTLQPTSRLNVQASADVPELGTGVFSAEIQVLNYQPIAVEKAMYWNSENMIWAAGTNVTATRLPPR